MNGERFAALRENFANSVAGSNRNTCLAFGQPLALRPPQRCALRELAEMQTTLAQIRQDRLLTDVRLYKALGRGWSLSDAQWTAQQHEMAR